MPDSPFHPDNPEQMHEILMRAAPHTFAEYVSGGQWKAAKHLAYISRRIMMAMSRGPDKPMRMIVNLPPRHGKLLAHDTPVLTTQGWKTHGELRPGHLVYRPDSRPTRVMALSEEGAATTLITFLSGGQIKAHPQHEWFLPKIGATKETKDLAIGDVVGYQRIGMDEIRDIGKCPPAPGRCIQVAAEDGMYLVGRELIPTHNSYLISKWLPIWYLDNFPKNKVIMCSYGEEGALEWGRQVRDEFATNRKLYTKLRQDVQSSTFWHTTEGGSMLSAGIGGKIMGRGFSLGIIDDPIKNREEADSPVVLQSHIDWFNATFYTRREPGAHIILLMHRWAVGDLAGYLMKKHADPWEVIKLPAVAGINDILGRQPGEALWPERIPLREFSGVDKVTWEAMYQQNPPSEDATRVYSNYTDEKNLDLTGEMRLDRYDLPLMLTFDFNVNPGMHALLGQYIRTGNDMMKWRHEFHGHRWKTKDALDAFEQLIGQYGGFKWPLIEIYGDRSGRSDNSSTVQTDYQQIEARLQKMKIKYHLNVPMVNPPIKFRVQTVNDALCDVEGQPHMQIHKECVRLIDDFSNQPTDLDGLPDKTNQLLGHAGDAAGYTMVWVRPLRRFSYRPQKQIRGR